MRYLVKRIPSTSLVQYDGSRYYCEIAGGTAEKSTVDTTGLLAGSKYLDVQTGTWYVYDELTNAWAVSAEGGSADPAVVEAAVEAWLDAHPEATTTVQDGSISYAKLDSTLKGKADAVTSLSDEIDALDAAVNAIVSSSDLKPEDVAKIVQGGGASKFFTLGDQIATTWQKGNSQLDLPLDIVAFHDIETQGGETKKAMWLQSHWAVDAVQFDASEAIYYCETALPTGTYHFVIGTTWGSHCVKDKAYTFTTTQEIPAHGQIVIGTNTGFYTWGAPDQSPANWRVYTFADATSITPIETLTLTEAANGTLLGTLSSATKYGNSGMNNLQRAGYGYNRWSQSAIRQWLNSDAPAGEWWTPQNVYDRPPQQLATLPGFMAGLPDDIKAILKPIKVTTALNTVSDSEIGTTEDTYDIFFCSSLEQEYIVPQIANAEGAYWPYWKERLELDSPQAQGSAGTNANHIRYAIENHNSSQNVRFRSAYRSHACHAWYLNASGNANNTSATYALRPAPACVIY